MDKVSLQRLVDVIFQLVFAAADHAEVKPNWTREQQATWVREHLANAGISTKPVGQSWGVLCEPEQPRHDVRAR